MAMGYITPKELEQREFRIISALKIRDRIRPALVKSQTDPLCTKREPLVDKAIVDNGPSAESRDVIEEATLPTMPRPLRTQMSERRASLSTLADSPALSRLSSRNASLVSIATSPSVYALDILTGSSKADGRRRPSVLSRLRTSISTISTKVDSRRITVQPTDFRIVPEHPEKRFIDSIGMVFPGVCDRVQCAHSLVHFVSTFRLCEPNEYTTALADHGVTYTDHCKLTSILSNFVDEVSKVPKRRKHIAESIDSGGQTTIGHLEEASGSPLAKPPKTGFFDTTEQLKRVKQEAAALNKLLEEITWNLQARGVPVMVCVGSFSLFLPYRISEAHIQILHVSSEQYSRHIGETQALPSSVADRRSAPRLSFISPTEQSSNRPKLERHAVSANTIMTTYAGGSLPHQLAHFPDRSEPYPLWPNAIPLRKRQAMSASVERYGADPYFRAWIRADINRKTRSSTYAKYLIEQEDDPFVSKRLEYTDGKSRVHLILCLLVHGSRAWKEQFPSTLNRAKYEHNRKLECRKTVEHGSRLRMLRFGFRHPIYPPHTPEMAELGLSKSAYQRILMDIDRINTPAQIYTKFPVSYMLLSWNKLRHRSTEDALTKVSEYLRQFNASQRRIVFTIEKIPGVYDRGLARNRTEWEISAWNADDPLKLLIQLEKWGIIENRLSLDEED